MKIGERQGMEMGHTIVAISTAMAESGIGIVRMSGEDSFTIADRIYRNKKGKKLIDQKSHTVHYGFIEDEGKVIDEVLVILMKGPHTFTGEDTIEIDCHGGVYVVKKIMEACIKNGARPAQPGEFTKRAFLNGKMDLSQAEAVIDVIKSQNDYALKSSIGQLRGSVKEKISDLRNKILYHTAFIESALDDPEHISIDGYGNTLKKEAEKIIEEIQKLLKTADDGRIIKEGINTVIIGKPNAGKSSLLNVLLGEERAIVTEIAGTTRDILQENINLQGVSLNIIDTAGIRNTDDKVEKIGVDKAKDYAKEADLIMYVVDSSSPLDENDYEIMKLLQDKKSIVLLNKSDLDIKVTPADVNKYLDTKIISISAKHNMGIDEFEDTIKEMFFRGEVTFNDEVYSINVRQKNSLQIVLNYLKQVNQSIEDGMAEDFFSIDLMGAYEELGKIIGESVEDDLVEEIFSKFCMGK